MGFPEGWVTGPIRYNGKPLGRTAQLKMLGNACMSQQAAAAIRALLPELLELLA